MHTNKIHCTTIIHRSKGIYICSVMSESQCQGRKEVKNRGGGGGGGGGLVQPVPEYSETHINPEEENSLRWDN